MTIYDEIMDLTGDPASPTYTLLTFPTMTSVMFNSPIAQEIGERLGNLGYEVDIMSNHLIEWEEKDADE